MTTGRINQVGKVISSDIRSRRFTVLSTDSSTRAGRQALRRSRMRTAAVVAAGWSVLLCLLLFKRPDYGLGKPTVWCALRV